MPDYSLAVKTNDGQKEINFVNNSKNFVEVIFTIDDKEVKRGNALHSLEIKGYGYPPKLEKPVRKMLDGSPLRWNSRGGTVRAYIFPGEGRYRNDDLDQPAFLRHKLVKKIKFKRTSDQPEVILETKYTA